VTSKVNDFASGCTRMVSIYSLSDNKFLDPSSYTYNGEDLITFETSGKFDIEFYFAENVETKYLTLVWI
jgi:hypothetical protein